MVLVLFPVRVQCGFHAGAGWLQAGTMRGRAGAGWQYLVRAARRVTHTLCRVGAGQQLYGRGAGAGKKFQPAQSSMTSVPCM